MKNLIAILVVLVVGVMAWNIWKYWEEVSREREASEKVAATGTILPTQLPGIPGQLEASLEQAQKNGAAGLKLWLQTYKRSPLVQDPRLAWIELDYVVALSREDPVEAKKVFAEIKKRTPPDSPVLPRIKALEKTYE